MSQIIEQYIKENKYRAEFTELFQKVFEKDVFEELTINFQSNPIHFSIKILDPNDLISKNAMICLQLQNMVAQRMDIEPEGVRIVLEKIEDKSLSPAYHAEMLRQTFVDVKPYKRCINSIIRSVRMAGGQGVSIRVSGKVKGQRARATKFIDGLLIQAGQPAKQYIKKTCVTTKCKQGVIGIQIKIMLPYDPTGVKGCSTILADKIKVLPPRN